jgi:competence protein ComEC
VIPISTIILYIGIAVFIFSPIPIAVKYIAIAFTWLIWILNFSVKWIESLPYSLLQGISISVFETWLLYGLIIFLFLYISNRKYKYLVLSLSVGIIILISQIVEQNKEYKQKKIMVYNIAKTSAIDFINAKSNVLLTDSIFAKNKSMLLFHILHNWWDLGLNDSRIISDNFRNKDFNLKSGFIQFLDKRIVILDHPIEFKKQKSEPFTLDYLIVSKNVKMSVQEMKGLFRAKKIIFDSSNSIYQIRKWKEECLFLNQEYDAVMDEGAVELIL